MDRVRTQDNPCCGHKHVEEHFHNPCGCGSKPVANPCGCSPEPKCECAVRDLSTNCIIYTGDDLKCSKIKKNTILTDLIQQLDAFICTAIAELKKYFILKNIGIGSRIYKGDSLLGEKELRTLISSDETVVITERENEIDFSAKGSGTTELADGVTILGVGTSTDKFRVKNPVPDGGTAGQVLTPSGWAAAGTTELADGTTILGTGTSANKFRVAFPVPNNGTTGQVLSNTNGTPVWTNAGTGSTEIADGTTILGIGTSADKFRVAFPVPSNGTSGQVLSNTNGTPNWTTIITDGSDTKLVDGNTTDVSGSGTVANPYKVEVLNLQKTISDNYTLQSTDDNFDIFVDCSVKNITITVPTGLTAKIQVCFFQKGANEVNFVGASGVTINSPIGFKIKGDNFWAYLTQKGNTEQYQLAGTLKV